jgi:NADPH:quinone reductase-like Zn-dependent oxidoreductase
MLPQGVACFAGDLSDHEQKLVWATQFAPAADLFNQKLDGTAWRSKPSWYIVANNDRTVQPELQRSVAKRSEPGIVLELADLPEPPAPAVGEVLIGVEHAPINMNDLYLIQGVYPVRPSLPSVVGNEGVGRVLAIGRGVDHLKVGDRVLVPLYSFSWRERLVAPAAGLFALPEADPRQLAMLGINPPTAALLLNESIDLRPGDWVAQNAANSGVGRSLIAIAKARGLKTLNFVRRPELVPELQAVGGDLVIVDQSGALDKIRATIGDARVPLGIDGVAGEASGTIAGVLSESGTLVV